MNSPFKNATPMKIGISVQENCKAAWNESLFDSVLPSDKTLSKRSVEFLIMKAVSTTAEKLIITSLLQIGPEQCDEKSECSTKVLH